MGAFLIVDDDYSVARAIARRLPRDQAVVIVHDPLAAEAYLGAGAEWSAFIIDVGLPVRSGFELLEVARNQYPDTPALLVTGRGDPDLPARAHAMGADLLTKPLDLASLHDFVARARRAPPMRGAASNSERPAASRRAVLVVDDDARARDAVVDLLVREGFTASAADAATVVERARSFEEGAVVLTQLGLRASAGGLAAALTDLRRRCPDVLVVAGSREPRLLATLLEVGAGGWSDPSALAELAGELRRILSPEAPARRPAALPSPSGGAMQRALLLADKLACSPRSPALIVGESGVGKEVLANRIHARSARSAGPFVKVNVAAIPDAMIEAELFGSVRGAFTDSRRDRAGLLASAHMGTLLLDEIGECRHDIQAKLLRVIETQAFFPLGADEERRVDVRVLAATNRPLDDLRGGGALRADLFFRFGTVIEVPPLRERRREIMPLAEAFAVEACSELQRLPLRFSRDARTRLESYEWPGNIRELRHAVDRAVLVCEGVELGPELFDLRGSVGVRPDRVGLVGARDTAERAEIASALTDAGGSATAAARKLGIARSTLYEKLKKYGLR